MVWMHSQSLKTLSTVCPNNRFSGYFKKGSFGSLFLTFVLTYVQSSLTSQSLFTISGSTKQEKPGKRTLRNPALRDHGKGVQLIAFGNLYPPQYDVYAGDFLPRVVAVVISAVGVLDALGINDQQARHGAAPLFDMGRANLILLMPAPVR